MFEKVQDGLFQYSIGIILATTFALAPAVTFASFIETGELVSIPKETAEAPPQPLFNPEDAFKKAVDGIRLGRYQDAEGLLRTILEGSAGTPWEKRASLLLGLMVHEPDDNVALIEDAAGIEDIDDYVLFFQADALARAGRFVEASGAFDFIVSAYPDSVLIEKARFRSASSYYEAGDFKEAVERFDAFVAAYPRSRLLPEALLNAARSALSLGREADAVQYLKKVFVNYPAGRAAVDAEGLLKGLKEAVLGTGLSDSERFTRAERLFGAARFRSALEEYSEVAASGGSLSERALLRAAIANARLKRYGKAEAILKDYLSRPGPVKEAEALYWYALSGARQGRIGVAEDALKRLTEKHPGSEERARVLLLIGRHNEGRDPEGAAQTYRKVADEFSSSPLSGEAFWSLAWASYRSGDYEEAFERFAMYASVRPKAGDRDRFLYWKGRSAQNLGNTDEAARAYESACRAFSNGYYCLMSGWRLEELRGAKDEAPAEQAPATEAASGAPDGELYGDRHYRAAIELLALGLTKEAADEVDWLARKRYRDKDALLRFSELLYEAEDYYRALRIYRLHFSGSDSGEVLSIAFPLKLVEMVRRKTASADPCLVAAVMREESHFDPNAVSSAGALGLMQIMPSTGRFIAGELGRQTFDSTELLDPDTNIELGAWYLRYLLKRFDNDIALAVAGYNAGPNAAARWAVSLPVPLDEFVESIPYDETRAYTKRVLNSYSGFLRLSGEDARGKLRRALPEGPLAEAGEGDSRPLFSEAAFFQ